ncbi:mannose-1-phosphate guanylyltransferase [Paenibacillus sp. S3N08]|uniref:Mannose-1-phosphate guanylyltransferase n=2 Tax=Paenibacillus agricola TaxID=2716264 RepID=A0ABX0J7Y7_9BACL|nr:mannose-1-phosphate guanylyltransferase [Paenibacillus agricola]
MKIVIMAGGKGNRFWPRSTEELPKQFLSLVSKDSMLVETYQRFLRFVPAADIYVATVHKYTAIVMEQLTELDPNQLIIEPEQQDTAPSIALITRHFLFEGRDEPFLAIPSDQYISDEVAFFEALERAADAAHEEGAIVTLGIVPTRPETGYGYIEVVHKAHDDGLAYRVKRFIEKPDQDKANELVKQPNVYWNSGIFASKPSTVAGYLERFQPEMWHMLKQSNDQLQQIYPLLPRISVDYAILEKADLVYCIPIHFGWDDVGSWTALTRLFSSDEQGNLIGGLVHTYNSVDNIIFSEKQKTLVIGVEGLIIVSTPWGLLVCHKSEEQAIKKVYMSTQHTDHSS